MYYIQSFLGLEVAEGFTVDNRRLLYYLVL